MDESALSARARLAAGFALGRVIYAEERRGAEERVDEFVCDDRLTWSPLPRHHIKYRACRSKKSYDGFALGRVIYAEERRGVEERVDEFALSARARLAAGFALGWVIYAEETRGAEERVDGFAFGGRNDGAAASPPIH